MFSEFLQPLVFAAKTNCDLFIDLSSRMVRVCLEGRDQELSQEKYECAWNDAIKNFPNECTRKTRMLSLLPLD